MKNKTCIITGGNAGIGKATCLGLAQKGATILLIARNPEKGKAAQQEIIKETGNSQVELHIADLSDQKQIRELAQNIQAKHPTIDVLINNAAMVVDTYQTTKEGFEIQWGVNHLAPFLLTNLLMPELKSANAARIITVSSGAHKQGKIAFDFTTPKNYSGTSAYAQSKLANVLFTYELARKIKDTNITANCLHPGFIKTNIGGKNDNGKLYTLGWKFLTLFAKSTDTGAATSIYLASSPEVEGKSGGYYDKSRPAESAKLSHDKVLAKKLWDISLQQTNLTS